MTGFGTGLVPHIGVFLPTTGRWCNAKLTLRLKVKTGLIGPVQRDKEEFGPITSQDLPNTSFQKYHAALGKKPDQTFEKLNLFGVFPCSQLLPMLKSFFFFFPEVCFNKCLLFVFLFFLCFEVLLQQPCDCESQPLGVSPLNGSDVEEKQQQRTVATFWEASSCLLHNEDGWRLGVYNARILYHYCFCCFLCFSPPTKRTLRRVWDQMSKSLAPPTSAHAVSQGSAAQPLMRPAASPWASLSAQCWMPPGSRLAGRTFSPSRSTFLSSRAKYSPLTSFCSKHGVWRCCRSHFVRFRR